MKRSFSKVVRLKAMNALLENRIFKDPDDTDFNRHWFVIQASGKPCDVWRTIDNKGIVTWSCNAVGFTDKKGEKHGCVYFKGDQTEPFCSHTLGAFLCK